MSEAATGEDAIVRVRDVMSRDVDFVDGMQTVREALERMQHIENKALIVKKRNPDDEWGMLLISDIARQVVGRDRAPDRVNVYEVMAKPVITVDPNMDIRYCARLLERFDLSRAPVVEGGLVVGMVSLNDLVLRGLYRGG